MMTALHQRCWNHEDREAVCRCPECGRSFCRECVGEHESRLLCAACLKATARVPHTAVTKLRFRNPALVLAGLVLGWALLFCAGEAAMTLNGRLEQAVWQPR
jgi:hypothetical protein